MASRRRSSFATWVNGRGPSTFITLVVATVAGLAAWQVHTDAEAISSRGLRATGVVVDVWYSKTLHVEVRYAPHDGPEVVAEVVTAGGTPSVGDQVPVLYDPLAPEDRVVDARLGADGTGAWVGGSIGALCLVLAALTWTRRIDWERVRRWHEG
ncbi:DUF3592 domain-containing protein [Cellulomonas xiejunii]|uniref:DUF3592 domain-containing protein n=1 Tax=Cellulomonas xiejunii TaxID=2968083 RepID=A0ABY5KSP3_9CELL|nr:DUF3592 domain-containing protein [Cellulomonas xiejunii]MCC2314557.1 DUF3592 domain-containing protein [Cellulomonas xiejunii]MCC2322728.1 DUF3592 domain-containing protein [Cellulomonas xiejunii]UUI72759.1 DUF3592 domain-containing protein [Cellulomonas xiejunii]